MNSDPNLEALLAELKADLPSERDSARLRTRLAALGIAAVHGVAGSASAATAAATIPSAVTGAATGAAVTATATTAAGIAGAGQASISAMALKTFAIALVAGAGVTSSAWYVQNELSRAEPVATAASVAAPVAPALAGTLAVRAAHEGPAADFERARSNEEPEAAPRDGTPAAALTRNDFSAKTGRTAAFAEAPATAPPGRNVPSSAATALRPASAVTPLVASGSNSMAAFAEPASTAASKAAAPSASAAASEAAAPSASATTERALEATTLGAETALLDRALSALRTSDTALAARLLSQHRARFPDGLLKRERERAERKLAELASGQGAP